MTTPSKIAAGLCLAAGIFLAGYMSHRDPAPDAAPASARRVLYYTCPMHPQYRSDRPGDAPCCGMRLVPVYAGDALATPDPAVPEDSGALQVSSAKQQLIGVRSDEVKLASASHVLRVPGRVTVDDARLYRLVASADGWVRSLGPNTPGTLVKKDDVLATYYTPNLLASMQTLVYAADVNQQTPQGGIGIQRGTTTLTFQVAIDSLRSLGMNDIQIAELQRTRQTNSDIRVYSPTTGYVIARNISPEQRFDKGTELYRIADLSHVWVLTDIFEKDSHFVKPGARATVRYEGREFPARMSDVLPQFDPQSRTLKVRFELDNPGVTLRPDMFVDVQLPVTMPAAVTVPADALLAAGRQTTVFVKRGNGFFEPRAVETGWRLGDRVQITRGLQPGEHIVVAGNFLLDSESRMKLAAVSAAPAEIAGRAGAVQDPVCGMDVDPKKPEALRVRHNGKTYFFCSDHCRKSFEANPGKYVTKGASTQDAHEGRGPA